LIFLSVFLFGCSAGYGVQRNTLAISDKIDVLPARVNNPYPKCLDDIDSRRVANLSVERSERVYLQEVKLCQRQR